MCSTYSGGFTDKIDYSSMIKRGTSKNSSDLERGTVPRSIGDEFFEVPLLVIEIWHRQFCTFHKDGAHFGSPTVLFACFGEWYFYHSLIVLGRWCLIVLGSNTSKWTTLGSSRVPGNGFMRCGRRSRAWMCTWDAMS